MKVIIHETFLDSDVHDHELKHGLFFSNLQGFELCFLNDFFKLAHFSFFI